MRRCSLWYFIIWLGFHCMHEIRKFYSILYKKYRHIISNKIIVSLLRIKFHGESTDITRKISLIAVCCSSASLVSLNSRTFSIAIAA